MRGTTKNLEAKLLYNLIDVTDSLSLSLTHNVMFSFVDHTFVVFFDRIWRSLRLCHLEFDKEAIYDG